MGWKAAWREFWSYYRLVFRQGWEILKRWSKGLLVALAIAVLTFCFQWHYGLIPPDSTWQAWASVINPYAAILIAMLIGAFSKAPVEIHIAQEASQNKLATDLRAAKGEVAALHQANAEVESPPALSAIEKARFEECRRHLYDFSEQEKEALRYALKIGELDERRFPGDIPRQVVQDALTKALSCNMVRVDVRHGTRIYSINPLVRAALEHLLLQYEA